MRALDANATNPISQMDVDNRGEVETQAAAAIDPASDNVSACTTIARTELTHPSIAFCVVTVAICWSVTIAVVPSASAHAWADLTRWNIKILMYYFSAPPVTRRTIRRIKQPLLIMFVPYSNNGHDFCN